MLRSEGGRGDRRRRRRAERGGTGTPPGWCQPPSGLQRAPRTLGTRSVKTMGWPRAGRTSGTPPGTTSSSSSSTPSPKNNLSSLKEEFLKNQHQVFLSPPSIHHAKIYRRKFTYKEENQRRTKVVLRMVASSFEHLESSKSSTSFPSSNDRQQTFSLETSSPGMSRI